MILPAHAEGQHSWPLFLVYVGILYVYYLNIVNISLLLKIGIFQPLSQLLKYKCKAAIWKVRPLRCFLPAVPLLLPVKSTVEYKGRISSLLSMFPNL